MKIREAKEAELSEVLRVERLAFGEDAEADLTKALLEDPSAKPTLSLLAFDDDEKAVGHILFTKATMEGDDNSSTKVAILAPLAVVPDNQKQGIGGKLIRHGLEKLKQDGVDLVFVLGYPDYYPRHGFQNDATSLGFEGTYPIAEKMAAAWMVQALQEPSAIGKVKGRVVCADALNNLKFWVEPSDQDKEQV